MDEPPFINELRTRTKRNRIKSDALTHHLVPFVLSHKPAYRHLLTSWYYIYKALEEELERRRRQHPKVSALYFRELLRTRAFEEDIRYFYNGSEADKPSLATEKYILELRECIEKDPVLLIAFCQTMHMATFSGGRILKGWIRRSFELPDGVGTKCFEFELIKDMGGFLKGYEEAVSRVALDRAEKERVIDRKKRIFEMNDEVLAEVREMEEYRKRNRFERVAVVAVGLLLLFVVWILVWVKNWL